MPKTRISVTIDDDLLERVDTLAKARSRSEVFEIALRHWLRENLEDELRSYYAEMGETERREDREWAELGLATFEGR